MKKNEFDALRLLDKVIYKGKIKSVVDIDRNKRQIQVDKIWEYYQNINRAKDKYE